MKRKVYSKQMITISPPAPNALIDKSTSEYQAVAFNTRTESGGVSGIWDYQCGESVLRKVFP